MISTTISSTTICIVIICLLAVASQAFLQIHHHTSCGHIRGIQFNTQQYFNRVCSGNSSRLSVSTSKQSTTSDGIEDEDDETLLKSTDPSTLQNLCKQYSLSSSGKSEFELFCCMLWCIRILNLKLVCLYVIAFASRMY